jgi:hypothetical protein
MDKRTLFTIDPYKTETKLEDGGGEKEHFSVREQNSNFKQIHIHIL